MAFANQNGVMQITGMANDRDVLKKQLAEQGLIQTQSSPPRTRTSELGEDDLADLVRNTQSRMEQLKALQRDMETMYNDKAHQVWHSTRLCHQNLGFTVSFMENNTNRIANKG